MKKYFVFYILLFSGIHLAIPNDIKVSYWIDSTSIITFNAIESFQNVEFTPAESNLIYGGRSSNTLWLKITPETEIINKHVVILTNAHLDTVDVLKLFKNDSVMTYYTGDHRPFNSREMDMNYYAFSIQPGIQSIYIRIRSSGSLGTPLEIYSEESYFEYFKRFNSLIYFYLGVSILTIILNLFLAYRLKDLLYFYYAIGATGFLLLSVIDKGLIFQFLWPHFPVINRYMMVWYTIPIGVLCVFAYQFLGVSRKNEPLVHYSFAGIVFILLITAISNLLNRYTLAMNLINIVSIVFPAQLILIGIFYLKKHPSRTIILFLIAWIIYLSAATTYILAYYDIVRMTFLVEYSLQYAHIIDIILLFIAVIDKVSILNEEKETAIKDMLYLMQEKREILTNQAVKLEQLVAERTSEIHEKSRILEETIEELKQTQNSLIQSEKMASLGVLTAGIAHEINNPLNFINTACYGLEDFIKNPKNFNPAEINEIIARLKNGVERINLIIKGLNQYSRNNNQMNEVCHLDLIIDNALLMLENYYRENITIIKQYKQFTPIKGNVGKLHQAFLNILNNAVQAIPEKGEINISIYQTGGKVVVQIKDTGVGIPREYLTRVTDPFFTTKAPNKGTGLGLYITFAIIEEHLGTMEFKSDINQGTTVNLTFPVKSNLK